LERLDSIERSILFVWFAQNLKREGMTRFESSRLRPKIWVDMLTCSRKLPNGSPSVESINGGLAASASPRTITPESIRRGEVQLAFRGEALVGTLRLLLREPIVWPEIAEDDAVYVYNLAVRRKWANQQLGGRLLEWASQRALTLGRTCVRLDCVAENTLLRDYYTRAGFMDRGEVDAQFPAPIGTLRLRRYEKQI
jgi:ribosomal protein S18 acetylase RimI-like enzyme